MRSLVMSTHALDATQLVNTAESAASTEVEQLQRHRLATGAAQLLCSVAEDANAINRCFDPADQPHATARQPRRRLSRIETAYMPWPESYHNRHPR